MDINLAIYLDYNATTPVAPEVVNEMLPFFLSEYGNPSSNDHIMGWQTQEAVDNARKGMADALNVKSNEIIFTAGATEAINMLLRGLCLGSDTQFNHIITLQSEHNAVLDTCIDIEKTGIQVSYLGVDENGILNLQELANTITDKTKMVSVMMVNNETGVIQPMKEISRICKSKGILFMSDVTQAIGKMPVNPRELGIDIMVGSAHKFYGPKGIGFLYAKKDVLAKMEPIITGGGQERKKRAGTLNVPGIIGMAKAVDLAIELMEEDKTRIERIRDTFEENLLAELAITINGIEAPRLYNTSNIDFHGVDSGKLMQAIGAKIAASRGSACSTGRIEPSHVLSSMGISEEEALSAIRFSFGRYTTEHEVDVAIGLIAEAVKRLKVSN